MTRRRILRRTFMLVLIAAAVYVMSMGMGAAENVSPFSQDFFVIGNQSGGTQPHIISGGADAQDLYPFQDTNGWLLGTFSAEIDFEKYINPWVEEDYLYAGNFSGKLDTKISLRNIAGTIITSEIGLTPNNYIETPVFEIVYLNGTQLLLTPTKIGDTYVWSNPLSLNESEIDRLDGADILYRDLNETSVYIPYSVERFVNKSMFLHTNIQDVMINVTPIQFDKYDELCVNVYGQTNELVTATLIPETASPSTVATPERVEWCTETLMDKTYSFNIKLNVEPKFKEVMYKPKVSVKLDTNDLPIPFSENNQTVTVNSTRYGVFQITTLNHITWSAEDEQAIVSETYLAGVYEFLEMAPLGDVNGDGILSSVDALMALQMSAGNIAENPAADVSGDGSVTSLDALMILQASVGAIVL